MDEYWFYGIFPNIIVKENDLTHQQKQIVENEKNKISDENYADSWVGYKTEEGWRFMRHGLIVIKIKESKSNVARTMLYEGLKEKYQ